MTLREISNAIEGHREAKMENLGFYRHFIYLLANPHYKQLKHSDILQLETDKADFKGLTKEQKEILKQWKKSDNKKEWRKVKEFKLN